MSLNEWIEIEMVLIYISENLIFNQKQHLKSTYYEQCSLNTYIWVDVRTNNASFNVLYRPPI